MNDDLGFINNIDGKILFEYYQYLTNAILGDDDTKKNL